MSMPITISIEGTVSFILKRLRVICSSLDSKKIIRIRIDYFE